MLCGRPSVLRRFEGEGARRPSRAAAGLLALLASLVFAVAGSAATPPALFQVGTKLVGDGEIGAGQFGFSVALSEDGRTAIVGASGDDGGNGAAWVYSRGLFGPVHGVELKPTDELAGGTFGTSVALSADGSTALVGGYEENGQVGGAWIFTRSWRGGWRQQGPMLSPNDEVGAGEFGRSVALSRDGSTALIGGNQDNGFAGAAWVFTRSRGGWRQQGPKLTGGADFGFSVALSADGSTALIGANNDLGQSGSAMVFTRSHGVWSQQGPKLTPDDEAGPGQVGYCVSLAADGSTALVGAPVDGGFAGAAWIFTRSRGGVWSQQGPKLVPNDESGAGQFGDCVSLSPDGATALVAANNDASGVGAAWVFTRSYREGWRQSGPKVVPNDESGAGRFGFSTALSRFGGTALVGGFADDAGVGAAWLFTKFPPIGHFFHAWS
jgi:FG-GAP repeat